MQTTCQSPLANPDNHARLGEFGEFNLGAHVGDLSGNVKHNRNELIKLFPPHAKIQWLNQVHSNNVVTLTEVCDEAIKADAAVTRCKNIVLAIMTADCLPILLSNAQGDEIAAIHGGWRPLAADIIGKTLNKMQSEKSTLHAWLGPCIGQRHFEVGEDVKIAFEQLSTDLSACFKRNDRGRYQASLTGIAKILLTEAGVHSISSIDKCTFTHSERYYSYRRQSCTGRMASLISLH